MACLVLLFSFIEAPFYPELTASALATGFAAFCISPKHWIGMKSLDLRPALLCGVEPFASGLILPEETRRQYQGWFVLQWFLLVYSVWFVCYVAYSRILKLRSRNRVTSSL